MKIGVDCDGVLTDMSAYIFEYGEKYFKRKPVNMDAYNTAEIFDCTEKEEFRFGIRYFFTYCKKWPPRKGAAQVLNRLIKDNNELYEITARKFVTMKNPLGWYSKRVFVKWLAKHNFHFQDIYFCSEDNSPSDKLRGCRKYDVDIMIDDKPEVALYLAENGVKVLLYDTRYNQGLVHDNITRVYNWKEIYKEIRKNDTKKK